MPTPRKAGSGQRVVAGAAAFSKFMSVLQLVADADAPPNVAALSAGTGFPRPTVYRIVAALIAEGMISENPAEATFSLGSRLINLASRSWERSSLRVASADTLRALRDLVRETVHLAVPSLPDMVYIDKLESPQTVRMASRVGTRVTLYSSSVGKAYLAALAPTMRDRLIEQLELARFTEHTITSRAKLREEIEVTAKRGYAIDNEENETQIFCYGAAILGADATPVGCVSISMPLFRRNDAATEVNIRHLLDACKAISAKLGRDG